MVETAQKWWVLSAPSSQFSQLLSWSRSWQGCQAACFSHCCANRTSSSIWNFVRLVDAAFVWTEVWGCRVSNHKKFEFPRYLKCPGTLQACAKLIASQENSMRIRVKITVQNEASVPQPTATQFFARIPGDRKPRHNLVVVVATLRFYYQSRFYMALPLIDTVQVAQSCVLQQTMVVEFQIVNQQCEDCQKFRARLL